MSQVQSLKIDSGLRPLKFEQFTLSKCENDGGGVYDADIDHRDLYSYSYL